VRKLAFVADPRVLYRDQRPPGRCMNRLVLFFTSAFSIVTLHVDSKEERAMRRNIRSWPKSSRSLPVALTAETQDVLRVHTPSQWVRVCRLGVCDSAVHLSCLRTVCALRVRPSDSG
jgi:hypothetical protein